MKTAYVLDEDGIVAEVEDYHTHREFTVNDYQEGSNYRDLFALPGEGGSSLSGFGPNMYFPASDGQVYDFTFGVNQAMKARMSDDLMHEPPRAESVKQTRLVFYDLLEETVTANASTDRLSFTTAHPLAPGDVVMMSSTDTLPAGLSAATEYYVVEASLLSIKVSATAGGAAINITDTGTGVHTLRALHTLATFKPGSWTKWSNQPFTRI